MNKTIVKSKIQSLSLSLSPPDHSCHFLSLHIFKLWAPHIAGPPQKHLTRWSFFGAQDQQRKLIRRSQSTETWGIPCSSSYFLYPIPVKAAENAFSNYDPVEIKYFLSKKKGKKLNSDHKFCMLSSNIWLCKWIINDKEEIFIYLFICSAAQPIKKTWGDWSLTAECNPSSGNKEKSGNRTSFSWYD